MPTVRHIVHMCHVTGCSPREADAMPLKDLVQWCTEATDYWNYINTPRETKT